MRELPPSVVAYLEYAKNRVDGDDEKVKRARAETQKKANAIAFERACAAAGIDPAGGISPALIANIKERLNG